MSKLLDKKKRENRSCSPSRSVSYPGWESNPHSFLHEFESCASTNSATRAIGLRMYYTFHFLQKSLSI